MGNTTCKPTISSPWSRLPYLSPARIALLGLDLAGRTTLLHTLEPPDPPKAYGVITTIPLVGCHLETLQWGRLTLTAIDVGGGYPYGFTVWVRSVVRENPDGLVFVVDVSDSDRIEEVYDELKKMWCAVDETRGQPILIMVNHGRGEENLSLANIEKGIREALDECGRGSTPLALRFVNAKTGEGVHASLGWLIDEINDLRSGKVKPLDSRGPEMMEQKKMAE